MVIGINNSIPNYKNYIYKNDTPNIYPITLFINLL